MSKAASSAWAIRARRTSFSLRSASHFALHLAVTVVISSLRLARVCDSSPSYELMAAI
ncbi:MAG: hypothetical protein LUE88_06490 [Clostridiales bacterium]|nr:hypothetical protein [Clostridiales bacterium]